MSQWQNFLRNLGEWRGSFTAIEGRDAAGRAVLGDSTSSILSLESDDDDTLVRFRLRRFDPDVDVRLPSPGDQPPQAPRSDLQQDYRSLGRQVVFFSTGTFCKGSLQVAPGTAFGAEFGFVSGDRRHRLVQLYGPEGEHQSLVLIREFRAGSAAAEQPPLQPADLLGQWQGETATISADWPEPELQPCSLTCQGLPGDAAALRLLEPGAADAGQDAVVQPIWLPDGGCTVVQPQISHRQAFAVQAFWLPQPDCLVRLVRRYDATGAWQSASHALLRRV